MRCRMNAVPVFLLLVCLGAASAQTPARQLLNGQQRKLSSVEVTNTIVRTTERLGVPVYRRPYVEVRPYVYRRPVVYGRKLKGVESANSFYRNTEGSASYNGAGVYSVTGPNGGSVEGAHTGSAQVERNTNTHINGRKLKGVESTNTFYRNTERTGSYSGAGVHSVTGPNGGSVEGAHAGSAQVERNTNTYVNGRKLKGVESTDSFYRNTERWGSYNGAGVYSVTGPNGGSVEGAHTGSAQYVGNTNTYGRHFNG